MAEKTIAKFQNDLGVDKITIPTKEFECMGASAPFDHPHIYLDMGEDSEIICPYCSTLYCYDPSLGPGEAMPKACLVT